MRPKAVVIWILILAAAFVLGFFFTKWLVGPSPAAVQNDPAPGIPTQEAPAQ
jgi:Flp pilus assembly protein CpaB